MLVLKDIEAIERWPACVNFSFGATYIGTPFVLIDTKRVMKNNYFISIK